MLCSWKVKSPDQAGQGEGFVLRSDNAGICPVAQRHFGYQKITDYSWMHKAAEVFQSVAGRYYVMNRLYLFKVLPSRHLKMQQGHSIYLSTTRRLRLCDARVIIALLP